MNYIIVTYSGEIDYDFDQEIARMVGIDSVGGGCCFTGPNSMVRDLAFRIASAEQAEWIAAKLRSALNVTAKVVAPEDTRDDGLATSRAGESAKDQGSLH